jgi:hypothetical protein
MFFSFLFMGATWHSFTTVLTAAADVKHTMGTDAAHMPYPLLQHSGGLDVAEAFDGQSKDFSAGVSHYTYSMPRHLPFMSLNPKNLKSHAGSAATGEQRERGTVLKPGSFLSGTSRFLAAKVWRPVRSGGDHDEDADVNSSHVGLTHIASECEDGVVDIGASHSAWIAEALECHYSSKFLCSLEFISVFV